MIERIKVWWENITEEQEKKVKITFHEKEPSKRQMKKTINSLKLEKETLEEIIKTELYKAFIEKTEEPSLVVKQKKEIKKLRKQVHELKEIIRDEIKNK